MPKFGVDVTGMSGVQGSNIFRMNVQEGVVDKSAAMRTQAITGLLEDVGSMGIEAYKGYAKAEYEKDINEAIDVYMAPRKAAEAEQEVVAADQTIDAMWKRAETQSDVTPEDITAVEKQQIASLKKYKSALDQGTMSPDQFQARVLDATRQAVAKNPGLYNELKQHASKVFELSGISTVLEADQAAAKAMAKQQEKQQEYLLGLAKENNIPVSWDQFGKPNLAEITPKIKQIQEEKGVVAAADRMTSFDEAQFRSYGTTYMVGKYNQANDQAIAILADESQPYDKRIATIKMMFNSVRQGVGADPRINRIIDKAPVQSSLKFLNDQIDTTIKTLEGFGSKEDAKKYLENVTNMVRNNQYLEVSKYVNPVASEALSKLLAGPWSSRVIESNPELMGRTVNLMSNLVQGIAGHPATDYSLKGDKGQPLAIGAIGQLAQDAGKGNEAGLTGLQKAVDVLYKDSKNPEKFPTTGDKFNFYSSYIKELGKSENRDGFKKVDDITRMKATESLDDYLNLTLTDMQRRVGEWEGKGISIQWDVLPDGRLTLRTNSVEAMEDLTNRYVVRVNDGVKAMANLIDSNTQSAAAALYPRYKDFFMSKGTDINKEIGDVTVNIKTREDALTAFNKGQITNQEYKAIIKDMKK